MKSNARGRPAPADPRGDAELEAVLDEVGASHPLLAYAAGAERETEETALDPVIFESLIRP